MLKNYAFLLIILIGIPLYSQDKLDNGEIVFNSGKTLNVLIQNKDWVYTPRSFRIKNRYEDAFQVIPSDSVKKLTVGKFQFVRAIVDFDTSSDDIKNISTNKNPNFKKTSILLRVILKGAGSLYSFERPDVTRYFYSIRSMDSIKQLIYKRYRSTGQLVKENQHYKQQLYLDINCSNNDIHFYNYVDYKKKDLIDVFKRYNQCKNVNYELLSSKEKSNSFITIFPEIGISHGALRVNSGLNAGDTEINLTTPKIGVNFEYVFSGGYNKWSVLLKTSYESASISKEIFDNYSADLKIDYNALTFYPALNYYFYPTHKTKFFLNAGIEYNLHVNSKVMFLNTNRAIDPVLDNPQSSVGLGVGSGIQHKGFMILLHYSSRKFKGRNFVMGNYDLDWGSSLSLFTFSLAYKFDFR
ncbi:hypothetical protein [Zunongwangia atlantica]|uniref:tRNA modification GTPase n=1 Tax=Zunongwangia atlantica 22II14-10F7 TaxID=1185767 RepID=A0A1Y1T3Y4_9FLAO|nr:hypothetical protein [Zunongwangia atlantica]ORL45750.1 hypothetical protein IIF7_08865 [Zunongwangia atlantica 22II14-10F7]